MRASILPVSALLISIFSSALPRSPSHLSLDRSGQAPVPQLPAYSLTRLPAYPPTISDLAWLEGTWRGSIGSRQFEARYSSPDGGQILSASKYTQDGSPAGFEFERFEQQGDSLVLTPFPEGKSSVSFPLSEYDAKARHAVFENLAHDFPTRISYQRVGRDRLIIIVSGPGEDGNEQVVTYALTRK